MHRVILLAIATVLAVAIKPANAAAYQRHYANHYGHYLALRHYRHVHRRWAHRLKHMDNPKAHTASRTGESLPGPCHTAATMGGPCGCWTEWNTRGFLDHVREGINWWLAGDWFRFPRAIPVLGTAAVYNNRSHVAPVLHANKDGTVTVRDYWGTHKVSMTMVTIVDPHPPIRAGWRAWGGWPL